MFTLYENIPYHQIWWAHLFTYIGFLVIIAFMCCQGIRILLLFLFTISSFLANGFFHDIPTVIWYFLFVNSFTFILFFVNFLLFNKSNKFIDNKKLYYFSGIGGIFGAILMMIFSGFFGYNKKFILFEFAILAFWCIGLIMLYKLYAPFEKIINNLLLLYFI